MKIHVGQTVKDILLMNGQIKRQCIKSLFLLKISGLWCEINWVSEPNKTFCCKTDWINISVFRCIKKDGILFTVQPGVVQI
jgi:hypothetical protein